MLIWLRQLKFMEGLLSLKMSSWQRIEAQF